MMISGPPQVRSPAPQLPFSLDLSDRRLTALMNVLVFAPYAVYLARGKRPPGWVIAATLAWTGLNFFDDLKYLVRGETVIAEDLAMLGVFQNAQIPQRTPTAPAPAQWPIQAPQTFHRYRVNR